MLPKHQKGVIQFGIIGLVVLTAGLFAATKLASNPDLTFFNIAEQAAGNKCETWEKDDCDSKCSPAGYRCQWRNNSGCKTSGTKCEKGNTGSQKVETSQPAETVSVPASEEVQNQGLSAAIVSKLEQLVSGNSGTGQSVSQVTDGNDTPQSLEAFPALQAIDTSGGVSGGASCVASTKYSCITSGALVQSKSTKTSANCSVTTGYTACVLGCDQSTGKCSSLLRKGSGETCLFNFQCQSGVCETKPTSTLLTTTSKVCR